MGLFKKEVCVLCAGKTGMLDKKCIDGKICKDCRDKLSVWFDDYKDSTQTDLLRQIQQKNIDEAEAAHHAFNRIYGESGVILIDDEARLFTALPSTSKKLFGNSIQVSSIHDVLDFHPDLISFDSVKDIEIDIQEMTHEQKRTVDGKQVSYTPPRYEYHYVFTLRFKIEDPDRPYVKSAYVTLNRDAVKIKNVGPRAWTNPGRRLAAHLLDLPGLIVEDKAAIYDNESFLACFFRSEYEMPAMSYGFQCTAENWPDIRKYQYYLALSREIKETIMGKDA